MSRRCPEESLRRPSPKAAAAHAHAVSPVEPSPVPSRRRRSQAEPRRRLCPSPARCSRAVAAGAPPRLSTPPPGSRPSEPTPAATLTPSLSRGFSSSLSLSMVGCVRGRDGEFHPFLVPRLGQGQDQIGTVPMNSTFSAFYSSKTQPLRVRLVLRDVIADFTKRAFSDASEEKNIPERRTRSGVSSGSGGPCLGL